MPMPVTHQAAVLGAGSWGTALAIHLAGLGHGVTLWGRDPGLIVEMTARRANPTYLPDITFPDRVRPTADLQEALAGAHHVIFAVPSHGLRGVVRAAAAAIPSGAVLVSATKGIEPESLQRMSGVILEETGGRNPVVVLSGPSFAAEVVRGHPTALVAASPDADAVRSVQERFRGPGFRLYASDDVVGVEIGGALKNVIAIAAGVTESLQLGHNALAALITRGLAEISRLACAVGGRRDTLAGLSGLGDLVLTCTGELSRNRHVGIELAKGRTLSSILASTKMVAEGVLTTGAALELGAQYGVELPIATQMAEVLSGRADVRTALDALMLRKQRAEAETGPHGDGVAG
jgi:glycerol-3-phosphate dehydrogenase (NAD(P)+)